MGPIPSFENRNKKPISFESFHILLFLLNESLFRMPKWQDPSEGEYAVTYMNDDRYEAIQRCFPESVTDLSCDPISLIMDYQHGSNEMEEAEHHFHYSPETNTSDFTEGIRLPLEIVNCDDMESNCRGKSFPITGVWCSYCQNSSFATYFNSEHRPLSYISSEPFIKWLLHLRTTFGLSAAEIAETLREHLYRLQ